MPRAFTIGVVEEAAWWLSVTEFRPDLLKQGSERSAVYETSWEGDTPYFARIGEAASYLRRGCPPWEQVKTRVEFEGVPWQIYGIRWFFRCMKCTRRRCTLFAPKVGSPFWCRQCHHLGYRSSQKRCGIRRRDLLSMTPAARQKFFEMEAGLEAKGWRPSSRRPVLFVVE